LSIYSRHLLHLAHLDAVLSGTAEEALEKQSYDLVVLCRTTPNQIARKLLTLAWSLRASPSFVAIDGTEQHRILGALTYSTQVSDYEQLSAFVETLLHGTAQDYGYLVQFRSSLRPIQYLVASTVQIQDERIVFINCKRRISASFLVSSVYSWNVLRCGAQFPESSEKEDY